MSLNRREFLGGAGMAAGLAADGAGAPPPGIAIIVDPSDPVAAARPAQWSAKRLEDALAARGIAVRRVARAGEVPAGHFCVVAAGRGAPAARDALKAAGAAIPDAPEAAGLLESKLDGRAVLLASGGGARGLVYSLLELADRVEHAADPVAALRVPKAIVERPANRLRGINRSFESDVEDQGWFHDRQFWPRYFSMLAAQRFNRFSLTLGLGYNFPRDVRDVYFYFAYPFLVDVPGYKVRATGVSDGERDRNLATLRFISGEAAARGLDFQLGLWTHAYQWVNSPNANHTIEGLTAGTHGAYCRDALHAVLEACPAVTGVTFRIHGESGVPEESFDFWKTVFEGIVRTGRPIEIDMHAKGMDQRMIDVAMATRLPIVMSPKYWAEHMGLSYHQTAIRELEMPRADRKDQGHMAISGGSRRFLRYGYGDLLKEDRGYGVWHRIWPGTQRHLLWGDPALAAGYGRASSFCGSDGIDICEPLSFKGRMGSGLPGGRNAYLDRSLDTAAGDWEKFLYTYRVWGRLLYNPDASPDTWRRLLRQRHGAAAPGVEAALAGASRVLPLITTAHGASGSNNTYWPEMYTNMPIVDPDRKHPYGDTPTPRRFGTVSPFDPQIFSTIDDFSRELLERKRSGAYSPVQVAQWLDDLAQSAAKGLSQAQAAGPRDAAEFRRVAVDVSIQSGTARFFALKIRSAVLFAVFEQTRYRPALEQALQAYRAARGAWAEFSAAAKVYAADVTYGRSAHLRGHWNDRLASIDADISDMEKRLEKAPANAADERAARAVREILAAPRALAAECRHVPRSTFQPGQPLEIELGLLRGKASAVRLHYRRVNQSERYRVAEMTSGGKGWKAAIPADYTDSPYPLEYYFTLHLGAEAMLYPGLGPTLSDQPYFVVRRRRA